jgi:DNA-binding transcriptional LysR family regulator
MDPASVWPKNLVDTFVRSKARLNLTVDNAPIETAKRMVALGLSLGFVPRLCVREETARGEWVTIEVEGLREERSLCLVRRRATHSHAAQAFIQVAVSFGTGALVNEGLHQSPPQRRSRNWHGGTSLWLYGVPTDQARIRPGVKCY